VAVVVAVVVGDNARRMEVRRARRLVCAFNRLSSLSAVATLEESARTSAAAPAILNMINFFYCVQFFFFALRLFTFILGSWTSLKEIPVNLLEKLRGDSNEWTKLN